jgi:Signal transduction histidine kinase regulating phosphoglycerate transport system
MTLRDGLPFCRVMDRDCPFHKTLANREAAETLMTRVNAEGRLLYFRIYSYPILDALGAMTHIMVMQRDITSRTYREKHQQQADKLAVIGEMSTYLAHEIRNPLFAIGGFTNALLRSTEFSGASREKLTIIDRGDQAPEPQAHKHPELRQAHRRAHGQRGHPPSGRRHGGTHGDRLRPPGLRISGGLPGPNCPRSAANRRCSSSAW